MGRVLLVVILGVVVILGAAGCDEAAQDTSAGDGSSAPTVAVMDEVSDGTGAVPAASVSFVAPIGEGDGLIAYVESIEGTMGPTSFCALPDGSIAILDSGELSIEVFDPTGEPLYTLDLPGIVYWASDIRWWNDSFAVLGEVQTGAAWGTSIFLIDTEGKLKQTIPLVEALSGVWLQGPLRVGGSGELMVVLGVELYAIADGQGNVTTDDEMSMARTTLGLLGGLELEIGSDDGISTWVRLAGSSDQLTIVPGTALHPLGSDDAGNTYLGGRRLSIDAEGSVDKSDYIVVRIGGSFAETDFAVVDEDSKLSGMGNRLIDVVSDRSVYSMVPKADGVYIETLEFSPTYPEL